MADILKIQDVEVEVIRKTVKNMNFTIYPSGKVRVSVPLSASPTDIEHAIEKKFSWIRSRQISFLQNNHQNPSFLHHRDRIPVFGEHKKLQIEDYASTNQVYDKGDTITLAVKSGLSDTAIEALLLGWYRQRLRGKIEARSNRWEEVVGARVNEWKIRKMKTRWGSCNILKRRIWLNLELATLPICCLDYVMVHEITHIFERYHNARFYSLLEQFYPSWKDVRQYMKRQHVQLQ